MNLGIENGTELPALLLCTNEQYFSYKNVTLPATPQAEANSVSHVYQVAVPIYILGALAPGAYPS
jgi:hypothetical protein